MSALMVIFLLVRSIDCLMLTENHCLRDSYIFGHDSNRQLHWAYNVLHMICRAFFILGHPVLAAECMEIHMIIQALK